MRLWVLVSSALLVSACDSGQLQSAHGGPVLELEADAGLPPEHKPNSDGGVDPDAAQAPPPRDAAVQPPPRDAAPPPPPVDAAQTFPEGQDECGDLRSFGKVYNGTRQPTALPLSPGQVLAVGSFNGCSGTLIGPRHVLSATHCGHRPGATFCMGEDPDNPDRCVRASRVYENPQADQTVLELERDAADVMPGVQPIPILTERMDQSWYGRIAEAGGYGQTEYGGFNTRWFTAEPIVRLTGDTLTIDGEGRHGVCFGDSGGPVMVQASDGSVRVAGDLSNGDGNCVGRDNYTRVDMFVSWVEQYTGPTVVGDAGCGSITAEGRCVGGVASWCDGESLQTERCGGACGWDARSRGFRCIAGADPCGGVDALGACDGAVARWCDAGQPRTRDCGACGQACMVQNGLGADCAEDPCGGVDYLGRCTGDVAEWCEDGELRSQNCGRRGQRCGWVDDQVGYFCN